MGNTNYVIPNQNACYDKINKTAVNIAPNNTPYFTADVFYNVNYHPKLTEFTKNCTAKNSIVIPCCDKEVLDKMPGSAVPPLANNAFGKELSNGDIITCPYTSACPEITAQTMKTALATNTPPNPECNRSVTCPAQGYNLLSAYQLCRSKAQDQNVKNTFNNLAYTDCKNFKIITPTQPNSTPPLNSTPNSTPNSIPPLYILLAVTGCILFFLAIYVFYKKKKPKE